MWNQGFTVCLSPLELLKPGEQGIVTRFRLGDEKAIAKLNQMGISPGVTITVQRRFPTFLVKADRDCVEIEPAIARSISVRVTDSSNFT